MPASEVIEAIAVDLDEHQGSGPEKRFEGGEDLLQICAGLIDIDVGKRGGWAFSNVTNDDSNIAKDRDRIVRIAHFSAQESLLSDRVRHSKAHHFALSKSREHGRLSKLCLLYLQYAKLSDRVFPCALVQRYAPAHYAARYWHEHYLLANVNDQRTLLEPAVTLLTTRKTFTLRTRLCDIDQPWKDEVNYMG